MARNVEIKARIKDVEKMRRLVAEAADRGPETLTQTDTFFPVRVGRLKLREFADERAELIYYRRPDATEPTESQYERAAIADPHPLRDLLTAALGVRAQVTKCRSVYWVGRTRVHLDEVRDLGNFLELEVVLDDAEPADVGVAEARRLIGLFGIREDALVPGAYVDQLEQAAIRDARCWFAGR
jgi:predicted adenylyl cyclase CyaB